MLQSATEILAQETANLHSTLNPLELLTPTNYLTERQKWLDGGRKFINPHFVYDEAAIRHASCQIAKILQNLDEIQQYFFKFDASDPLYLVSESLFERGAELAHLRIILDGIASPTKATYVIAWNRIYGNLQSIDIDLAEAMIGKNPAATLIEKYIDNAELPETSRQKNAKFFKENLNGFRGAFSETKKTRLKSLTFDANGIAKYFQLTLDYMRKHAHFGARMGIEEENSPTYLIDVSSRYTSVCTLASSASGKSIIGIPANRKVNGLRLIELIGHELNSHYRSAMNTRNLFRNILEYRQKSDFISLAPLLSHSLNKTMSEGFAKLSDTQVLGVSGLPKPYPILAASFIEQGHNFQETMEYVFDLSLRNHRSEDVALDNAWKIAYRLFRGQTDTSSHCGYVFTKDKSYFCGFTRLLNEISRNDGAPFEETIGNFLRYSTLTAKEIQTIDEYVKKSGVTSNDPFRDLPIFIRPKKNSPISSPFNGLDSPTIYIAELLL